MTKHAQPQKFTKVFFDSRTTNLLLAGADGGPVSTADGMNRDDVADMLGKDIADLLFASPSSATSGWEFEAEGNWMFWRETDTGAVVVLEDQAGVKSRYVANAFTKDAYSMIVNVQERDAPEGAIEMSVYLDASAEGLPTAAIHDAKGNWVATAHLSLTGEVCIEPGATMQLVPPPETAEGLLNADNEVVVHLPGGWTMRSGSHDGGTVSGEYVRVCRPDGSDYVYYDKQEWADDPAIVMGAIMNIAAGFRPALN